MNIEFQLVITCKDCGERLDFDYDEFNLRNSSYPVSVRPCGNCMREFNIKVYQEMEEDCEVRIQQALSDFASNKILS